MVKCVNTKFKLLIQCFYSQWTMQGRLKGCTYVSEYVEINTHITNKFRRERNLEIQHEVDLLEIHMYVPRQAKSFTTFSLFASRELITHTNIIIKIIITPLTIVKEDQWRDLECLHKACQTAIIDGGLLTDTGDDERWWYTAARHY